VEGTSGCHEPCSFTGVWSRQPWRLPHVGDARRKSSKEPKLVRQREGAPNFSAEEGERQRCQRLGFSRHRGTKTPTLAIRVTRDGAAEDEARQRVSAEVRRSVHGCRETLGTPIIRTEPKVREVPRDESRGVSRERTRYGYTHYRSGGRSRSDASRVLSSGRSQGLVESQGASQKEARKHCLTQSTSR